MSNDHDVKHDWYATAFDALYPLVYAHRTIEAAAPEAAFAAAQLGLGPEDAVLDLCCGNGRHLLHARKHTQRAAGLDYSAGLLSIAQETLGKGAKLVRGDMRALPFIAAFDAVLNYFTSFGYFTDPAENRAVVRCMSQALKPGGRFFIDYLNPVQVAATLVPESERESQGYTIREERWIDQSARRVNKITVVTRDGEEIARSGESVRLYGLDELRAMLAREQLEIDRVFGNYDGAPLADDQPRMILTGHKAGQDV